MESQPEFDVFLCHNSEDKPKIREIKDQLKQFGLYSWLDEEELVSGSRWLKILQEQIVQIPSAAIFYGSHGVGRVQKHEIEILLNESMKRELQIIPVLLNGVVEKPDLSPLLELRGWVNFCDPNPIQKLFEGIKGKSIDKYLRELNVRRATLEERLKEVELEIGRVTSSLKKSVVDPELSAILDWLEGRENLAKKYGGIALKKNLELKQELKERNETQLFYIEIDSCLEILFYAFLQNNESLLYEPGIPMLVDEENYQFASSDIYRETFRLLKLAIPPNFESFAKSRLENYIDQLVERFLFNG